MTAGLWERVHVASLVPKEKKEIPKTQVAQGGGMMGGGMMGGMMSGGSSGSGGQMQKMMGQMMGGSASRGGGMMGGSASRGGMMGGGMMGGGMTGGSESAGNYWKTDEKTVMIRAFDFTVQRDVSYRYRVRVVVFNPNYHREDVAAGVDTKTKELRSGWSDPTDEVHMPPDVMPYAIGSDPVGPNSDMKVNFQVVRFRPSDGVTVTRNFSKGVGEVIGEPRTAEIPSSDGTKSKNSTIDFNSHQIVLDINASKKTSGYQQLPPGFVGPPIERPALTLLLRPDGSVIVHNEADDIANEVRRDIDANYKHEIAQSGKERKHSMGTGMMGGGMMGGMGMSGGGMGGGMLLPHARIDTRNHSSLPRPTRTPSARGGSSLATIPLVVYAVLSHQPLASKLHGLDVLRRTADVPKRSHASGQGHVQIGPNRVRTRPPFWRFFKNVLYGA